MILNVSYGGFTIEEINIVLSFGYYEPELVDYEKEDSFKVAMRVREIAQRAGIGVEEKTVYIGNVAQTADAAGKEASGKDGGAENGKNAVNYIDAHQ